MACGGVSFSGKRGRFSVGNAAAPVGQAYPADPLQCRILHDSPKECGIYCRTDKGGTCAVPRHMCRMRQWELPRTGDAAARKRGGKWKIRIAFLRTVHANIFPVIRGWKILTACSATVRCIQRKTVREIPYTWNGAGKGSKTVPAARFHINRRIMIR